MPEWIETADGSYTLYDKNLKEAYHSRSGAWSECQNVFLRPFLVQLYLSRKQHWKILDLGFGLGLNWLCYVNSFLHRITPVIQDEASEDEKYKCKLEITSLEHNPDVIKMDLLPQPLGNFPIHNQAFELLKQIKKDKEINTNTVCAKIMVGDVKDSLKILNEQGTQFDVVLQDMFSPKTNPECWDKDYFSLVAGCCVKGSILLTYSVSGKVRKNLESCGFETKKVPGFGAKKEQLVAIFSGAISNS